MDTINLKFNAKVKKVDVAFERASSADDRVRALDVTLEGIAPGKLIAPVFGCDYEVAAWFWSGEDQGPALAAVGPIKATSTFSNVQCKLGGTKYNHTNLRNFVVRLVENESIQLSFIVRFVNLDEKAVGHLCSLYDEIAPVEINSAQRDALDAAED